jgi:hypothetical protein
MNQLTFEELPTDKRLAAAPAWLWRRTILVLGRLGPRAHGIPGSADSGLGRNVHIGGAFMQCVRCGDYRAGRD